MSLQKTVINEKFKIIENIAHSAMSDIWLAQNMENGQDIVLKILKKEMISNKIENVSKFKNEAIMVSKLDKACIAKIYEIGEFDNTYYIAMEYLKGKSLQDVISENYKFTIEEIVQIIKKVCQALVYIHGINIIHRDIKPSNIFIDFLENEIDVKLLDFGLSQIIELRNGDITEIVKTLCYKSPEQSGILNKNVSETSDLYSLGIIFYQLLAGQLPFYGQNVNEILHQQIAKLPESLSKINSDIPLVIENIVFKLLEKEPEKRYQTAKGLLNDLDNYQKFKNDFLPTLGDGQVKPTYKTEFIGREEELKILKQLFYSAINKKGGICLIAGEAGVGKTRLLEEFKKYVISKKALFIGIKPFKGGNKIPFAPLKDALSQYINIFKKYPDEKKNIIKQYFKKVIGNFGEIIIEFNSLMKEILGECPSLEKIEPGKEKSRFNMIISQLFLHIAKIEQSFVLHIDDMQWIDKGSIDIIYEILKNISQNPMLIVCTYRNDEFVNSSFMVSFVKSVEAYSFTKFKLSPFDEKKMNKFVANLLHDTIENTVQTSRFIFQKSKGNPYFAVEILKQLIDENVVVYIDNKWAVDLGVLEKTEIPESIVDLIIKKISALSEDEISVLLFAAVVGREFNIELLFILTEKDEDEIVAVVNKAIELRILEEELGKMGEIAFLHSKIREYFYNNIDETRKKELHFKIASVIEIMQEFNNFEEEKRLFDLAHHYIEADDKEKILEYAYPAALKAKERYAFELAVNYFKLISTILEENNQTGEDKWIQCMENMGEICLTLGKYDDVINIFSKVLPFLNNDISQANVYKQISQACFKKSEWAKAEQFAKKGLDLLGEKLRLGKFEVIFSLLKQLLQFSLGKAVKKLFKYRYNEKNLDKNKKIVQFYYTLSWLYMLNDIVKCINSTFRMLNISENKIGPSKELALSLSAFGSFTLTGFSLYDLAIKYHEKAIEMKKEFADEWGIAESLKLMSLCYEWKGEYKKSIQCGKQSIEKFKKTGDTGEILNIKNNLVFSYYCLADYDNAIIINNECFKAATKSKDIYGIISCWEKYLLCYIEKGEFEKAEQYAKKAYKLSHELAQSIQNWLDYCIVIIILGAFSLEKRDVRKAIEYLEEAKEIFEKNSFIRQYTVHLYCHLANAYIQDYVLKAGRLKKTEKDIMLKKIKKACQEAVDKTSSWATYNMSAFLVYAKYYSLINNKNNAQKLFKKSIELGKKQDRKYELGKTYYEYGKYLKSIGLSDEARKNLQLAYNIFKDIGAKAYHRKAANILGIDESAASNSDNFLKNLRYNQRLSSIISLGQDISAILDLDILLQKVLAIAIQVTGATFGYLMLKDERTGEMSITSFMNVNENEKDKGAYSQEIIDIVRENEEAVLVINALEDDKFNKLESVIANSIKSVLCIPIRYNNELKGICYLSNPLSSGVFKEEDKDILNVIMTQAAISFENAKLYKMAITDGLTGLITHKHFKFMLKKEIERTERSNDVFSLILFDIDFFKKFNDTYGHQAGDLVLIKVSEIAREVFRKVDVIARYGGEEFIVILPDTDLEGARVVAERLRKTIEENELLYQGALLKITISLGVSSYPVHSREGEVLIKLADQALYASKESGRNKVTVAPQKD